MSLDYPDYLRIRERSRWLGWLWMIGDRGYYLGLIGAVLSASGAIVAPCIAVLSNLLTPGDHRALSLWQLVPFCLVGLPICVVVFFVSVYLKTVAHRRSGIHDEDRNA